MWPYFLKIILTAIVVVVISEIAKRSSFWAAVIASLPLTSLLAFVWLYFETGDTSKITELSRNIFWLVLPSLLLFVLLPFLLRAGWGFWSSLATSSMATVLAYFGTVWTLNRLGFHIS